MDAMDRRQFLRYGMGTFVACAAGIGGYTWQVEPHFVETVHRLLPIEHLPTRLRGNKLVHVSDFHVGPYVDSDYLTSTFRKIRSMNPDIITITGDLITYRGPEQFTQLKSILKEFPHGRRATVAILGNHDYGRAWSEPHVADRVLSEMTSAGITVLRNEAYDVDGLLLIGMDDLWAGRFVPQEVIRVCQPSRAAIVLCHNPDALDRPGWGDYVGWVLSGHTHGGQCKPPFLPPPLLPVQNHQYISGELKLSDGRRVYINRGLGHLLKVRFNVRPEITLFTLV
jgi:hypothetical protein